MAVDVADVSTVEVEPGELPATMAAWVLRPEREGELSEAYEVEEIEVPEPGAFEVIVRVMAAGMNFNSLWAAYGEPVSVFGYGDNKECGHHIAGSDASGIVWKVGAGVTRWKPGDEVVIQANHASYEDVEVHGLDPLAAPSQLGWGYQTTWGSFAQFCKVPGPAAPVPPAEPLLGRLLELRGEPVHRLQDVDRPMPVASGPQRSDLGRGGRARGVRDPALQGRGGKRGRGRLL